MSENKYIPFNVNFLNFYEFLSFIKTYQHNSFLTRLSNNPLGSYIYILLEGFRKFPNNHHSIPGIRRYLQKE